ncbi:DinB family protein [Pseudonocardia hispaniensis]|uniref:DinB family protein n=1 Tax=Pseudonocardia hispaniensis TaxID=904933 RepID=A0ABW1IZV3_9PSEU
MSDTEITGTTALTGERADLVETLDKHRNFLRLTARGLSDEQAARRATVSELCIGGLIKHVTGVERAWADFIVRGAAAMAMTEDSAEQHALSFRMLPGETLALLLERYAEVARRTDELVATVDLDTSHPLPAAPWFEPGARWSVRRTVLHIVAETAQHAGHADILREAIDGAKSMG